MKDTKQSGQLDNTFATDGRFSHPLYHSSGPMLLLDDGYKVLISTQGSQGQSINVFQLRQDGSPDTRFGDGGIVQVPNDNSFVRLSALSMDDEERIYALGFCSFNGAFMPYALRLNSDGTPDTTFGDNGNPYRRYPEVPLTGATPSEQNQYNNGQLPQSAPQTSQASSAQWLEDTLFFQAFDSIVAIDKLGALQTRFNESGHWRAQREQQYGYLASFIINRGKIIACVNAAAAFTFCVCLDAQGNVDTAFGSNGYLDFHVPGYDIFLSGIVANPDPSRLIVHASFNNAESGDHESGVIGITDKGQLNPDFNNKQPLIFPIPDGIHSSGITGAAFWLTPQIHPKLYLSLFQGDGDSRTLWTLRLNNNGSLDTGYGNAGWAHLPGTNYPSQLAHQGAGKTLLTATLQLPGDESSNDYVIRLNK